MVNRSKRLVKCADLAGVGRHRQGIRHDVHHRPGDLTPAEQAWLIHRISELDDEWANLPFLTGERAGAYDLFGPACEAALTAHGFSTASRDCELIIDKADDDLWACGAACLIISNAVYSTP